jgi:primosomal protein N' (replication factor Y)
MIGKIRNEFLYSLLIKVPRNQGRLNELKAELLAGAHHLQADKKFRSVRVVFDVDPV